MTTFITVAIPYVNAEPHIGYAYELIEADLAARARRALGEPVRFLGGTDEFSLKNVLAAEAAGETTRAFVDRHADRFEALAETLDISFDDFIRTSRDPRHRPAVNRLWRACANNGDLYPRDYTGSYCVGCEQFYDPDDLVEGGCPEHGQVIETVTETNWFFRLSRYTTELIELIEANTLRITPEPFRAEVLAFLRRGLDDISVSRSVERARGWGIAVPDDPTQVVYVWFDALTNYISALDYGINGDLYQQWWNNADERIHVVGKGITRFHAVYWPAFLLSAGEPIPTRIHVHPYLSVNGTKISKSSGSGPSPADLVDTFGSDALRWWVTSDVSPTSDTDFTVDRLVQRTNETLANGLGNAINRIQTLRHRGPDRTGAAPACEPLPATAKLRHDVATALADFDRRRATERLSAAIDTVNQHIESTAPWKLLREPSDPDRLADLLDTYAVTLDEVAQAVQPITPQLAVRASSALNANPATPPTPLFKRLESAPPS
jgi:methionyl-tRNA synthetase